MLDSEAGWTISFKECSNPFSLKHNRSLKLVTGINGTK